jgi:myo-inositol-1(or 4)-monophosphatase
MPQSQTAGVCECAEGSFFPGIVKISDLTARTAFNTVASMSLKQDLQYAIELARAAGKIVLEQWGHVERLTKTHIAASAEAVTEADRASQRLIVSGLRRRFPKDGIIGEESESGSSITFDCTDPNGRVWVIDPIDGTNNFIAGLGAFAVCIGLLERGQPELGVVFDVTRDQVYSATVGEGAWLGTKRLHVVQSPLNDASMLMLTSNLLDKEGKCPPYAGRWIAQTNWKIRMLGSAAIECIQVAAGVAHGAVTVNGKLWDVAAPAAILLEAGGVLSDLKGQSIFPFDLNHYQGAKVPYLAAAPAAKAQLLREIQQYS